MTAVASGAQWNSLGQRIGHGVVFGLLHVTGEGLQCLVALLAPDTLEHVLYPGALGGLADPLRLPGTPRGRGLSARARAQLRPVGEVDEARKAGHVGTRLLHLIKK